MEGSLPGALLALAYFWRVPALRPVPGPAGPAPGKRRGPAAAGQRVGQPVPAVVPRAVCLSAGLLPQRPTWGPGAGPALRRRGPVEGAVAALASAKPLSAFGRRKFLWVVLGCGVLLLLVWHSFRWQGGAVYSSQATYGDMSMHLSFLTSLANQGTSSGLLPAARRAALLPFLSDSISASLYLLGRPCGWPTSFPCGWRGPRCFLNLRLFRPDGP